MNLTTVIFDMDGLLIDSEPLWNEAANEVFQQHGLRLSPIQYATTTGLRTKEFVHAWFTFYKIPMEFAPQAEKEIIQKVIDKVAHKGKPMTGVAQVLDFFMERKFKIGLATSSPNQLIDAVMHRLQLEKYFHAITSAEELPYGKPHPQVYLNCAEQLDAGPAECICFEDSFNGMIAAKAARMKCVIVPTPAERLEKKWGAADIQISSLQNFNELLLRTL